MDKPVVKSGPKQSEESLQSTMADIREQLRFIMEQDGLYRPLWQWYKNHEGDDEITTTMKKVEQFYSRFSDLDHRLATGKEVTEEDSAAIKQLIANMPRLMQALDKAETLVTKADDKKGEGVSDALAVLRAMKAQYTAEEWEKAQKKVSSPLKKGWIMGETSACSTHSA